MSVGIHTTTFGCSVITSLPSDIHTFTLGGEINESIDNMKFPRGFSGVDVGRLL